MRTLSLAALLALTTAGCLPSCQKREDKTLLPADSTSRALALTLRADTLETVWTNGPDKGLALTFPRTVRFSTTGDTVWIADAQANRLVALDTAGTVLDSVSGVFNIPMLAGFRGDTLVVFSAGVNRFDLVAGGRVVRSVPVPNVPDDRSLVRYGHAFGPGFAVKMGGRKTDPFVLVLDAAGREVRRVPLSGKLWRNAGLLRTPLSNGRSDTLYSLVGFVPVVDRIVGDRVDSVALVGFDSPKLDQRRRFLLEESDAPLLTTSAAPMPGGRLFVSNIRPGWLAVDVYDGGRLTHRLLGGREALNLEFLVEDVDVHRAADGSYRIATVQAKPRPLAMLYRWQGR
ncbi:MAG: hypothetical protein IAE99_11220 [Rhodothermales bacterium]|nr:hypothetical protein [Rhodothermales bacterium]MCA0268120.1 hypothetical protein [Bacteroidota bacterium]